jgi:hypothetical protein
LSKACTANHRLRARYPKLLRQKGQMTDSLRSDTRLRTILTSWYRSPRYRSEALMQHRRRPVLQSSQTELNRELERKSHFTEWQWFLVSLIVFMIVDYFYLQRWG